MIIFVAGMPRAGSMWTYNVVRAIYETKNYTVLPKLIPIDELELIGTALISDERENEVYCIKTHKALNNPLPTKHKVKIICNIRDVRDACLSIIRFGHLDYEEGMKSMISMMEITDYYQSTFKGSLLNVRFEDLTNHPSEVLVNISHFLEVDLSKTEKDEILRKFDKSNIQERLRDMPNIKLDSSGQVISAEHRSKFDAVRKGDGTYCVFDKTTAFQSDHITSTNDGEWKTYFSKKRSEKLNKLSRKWLLKYGYKI
jgi:hypothetical protein